MFNFESLDIQKNTNDIYNSFVGIRKNSETNRMTFYLPKGFEDFEVSYESVKSLFFSMYKTFKRFEIDNISRFDKMLDEEGRNRDNTHSRDFKGYRFSDEEGDNEVLFYSKIDIIDNFFKSHKELDIDSIVQRFGYTENIDYSNIEILLSEGVFLENNAIFISENESEKSVIESSMSELVELYCYIYKELLIELNKDVSPIVSDVADNFSYKYLTSLQSLFSKDSYELTILILKDCLDIIDKRTAYKDYLYYNIYEVVEQFLYGQLSSDDNNGNFWGINNFSFIWEDMCNSFVLSDSSRKIIYCDSSLKSEKLSSIHENLQRKNFGGHSVYIDKDFTNNFNIELNGYKRWLRPDLLISNRDNGALVENPLDNIINKKYLFIKKYVPTRLLNFGDNNINVDISIKSMVEQDENTLIAEKIFNLFSAKFSNLYRNVGTARGSLRGYRYTPKSRYSFSLTNISEDKFSEIYHEVYSRGENINDNHEPEVYIVDWKYVPSSFFSGNSKKLKLDVIKQLTYEFCITKNEDSKIKTISQFCIPKFCDSNNLVISEDNSTIAESNINIVSLNFNFLQREYVSKKIEIS